jgi:hypothetical protein
MKSTAVADADLGKLEKNPISPKVDPFFNMINFH